MNFNLLQRNAMWRWLTAALLVLLAAGCAAPQRWHIAASGEGARYIQTISPRYLWMAAGLWCGQVTQYDMNTGDLKSFADPDGLPLSDNGVERIVAGADDRCLLMLEFEPRLFVYLPGKGWRRLPPLASGYKPKDVAFDTDGSILTLAANDEVGGKSRSVILRLGDAGWAELMKVNLPNASALVPLADCYVIKSDGRKAKLFRVNKADDGAAVELTGSLPDENGLRYFQVGDALYMATPTPLAGMPPFPGVRVMASAREITPAGLVEKSSGSPQMLDLQKAAFTPVSVTVVDSKVSLDCGDGCRREQDVAGGASVFPIRDKRGDIWLGNSVFADRKWQSSGSGRSEVLFTDATTPPRAYYDDAAGRWRRAVPKEYGSYRMLGTDGKQAWAVRDFKDRTMQLLDLSGPKVRVLREVPREPEWGLPSFHDERGAWWMWRWNVVRLDAQGKAKRYPLKSPSDLWRSPRTGAIWTSDHPNYYRYNAEKDAFEISTQNQFYDDFAFRLGRYEFALLPLTNGLSMTELMLKVDGRWQPLGTYGARQGDRVLWSTGGAGAWEYDAKRDRSLRLHTGTFHVAFDARGRRVLSAPEGILLYAGDPFDDPHAPECVTANEAEAVAKLSCLQVSESQNTKDAKAVARLGRVSPLIRIALQKEVTNPQRSPDVRRLIGEALAAPAKESYPPALFRATFPVCPEYQGR